MESARISVRNNPFMNLFEEENVDTKGEVERISPLPLHHTISLGRSLNLIFSRSSDVAAVTEITTGPAGTLQGKGLVLICHMV